MKKLLPLLIFSLFLASGSSGAVVLDSVKHTLISDSDTCYEGIITKGTKEKGSGVFVVESGERKGNRYEGNFLGEKFHGQGIMTFFDGRKYVGEWKDDKYHGQGTAIFPNGLSYVGEWQNGKEHGQGTLTFPDGSKYVGEWKDDKYHGQGTYTTPDGEGYVGEWKDGNYYGKGILFKKYGVLMAGIWDGDGFKETLSFEEVSNFLKKKYPQFKGFNYQSPNSENTPKWR